MTRAALALSPDTPISRLINVLERNGVLVMALPPAIKWDAFSAWAGDPLMPVILLSASVGRPC